MNTIGIKCVDQTLTFTNTPLISTGDQNVDKISFTFCPLWTGYIKIAVFYQDKGDKHYSLINPDGICEVPNAIMQLTGNIYIAVCGTNSDDQVRTSNVVRYRIEEGVTSASLSDIYSTELSEEEQQDVYHKMLEITTDALARIDELMSKFAYVKIKDANTFEYDESKLEKKINAYTYSKSAIDAMVKRNVIEYSEVQIAGGMAGDGVVINDLRAYGNGSEIRVFLRLSLTNVTEWTFNVSGFPLFEFVEQVSLVTRSGESFVVNPAWISVEKVNDAYGIKVTVSTDETHNSGQIDTVISILI